MKKAKVLVSAIFFIFCIVLISEFAIAMEDREGVNWRTDNAEVFIVSAFQAILGRGPSQADMNWAMELRSKTRLFWALIASQEYQSRNNFPRVYNIYRKSKWIYTEAGGLERTCNCYYFAEFAYYYIQEGSYTYDVARSLVLMNNAFDRESCPYYDCGYSDDFGGRNNSAPVVRNNLVRDPNFAKFGYSSGPWGKGVLYGQNGIWWNSRNARATASTQKTNNGKTVLYINNKSRKSPHVYGTTAQRIKVKNGQRYRISFWGAAKNLAASGGLNIAVDPQWNVRPVRMEAGSYGFKKFSGTFTAKSSYVDLRIIMEDSGEVWLKKMKLRKIK